MRLRLSRLLGAVPAAVAIVWACLLCCGVPAAAARPHTYPLPQPHQLSSVPASLVSELVVLLFAAAIVAFVVLRTRGRRHATTAPVEPLPAAAKPAQRRKAA